MATTPIAGERPLSRRPNRASFPFQRGFWSYAWLPFTLLCLSIVTTASSGARFMQNFRMGLPPLASETDFIPLLWILKHPEAIGSGWSFSLALLTILLAHEAGHSVYCRKHGIWATLPYVLPAPTLSGTAGAVIRIRSSIPSRKALIEVGVAGPIAGYVVAVPMAILGLLLSKPLDANTPPAMLRFHQPLTIILLHKGLAALLPGLPHAWLPHPVLLASWVGVFITSLNLIPAGQLDGGHILYAISPKLHRVMTFAVPLLLLGMGVELWTGWLLWGLILLLPAMRHPFVPSHPELDRRHRWLGLVALAILVLSFLPAPFAGTGLRELVR